jgi:rod shape-determining protein MreB
MTVLRPSRGGAAGPRDTTRDRRRTYGRSAAIAIDLGNARIRAWSPGRGLVLDTRTVSFPGSGTGDGPRVSYPVQRGAIVDPEGVARLFERLLGRRTPLFTGPVIALTTPVLGGLAYKEAAHAALAVLRPRSVVTIPTAKAIALGAGADPSRPQLIVDVGAHLTEVFLLADGAVADAHRTTLGTDDLGHVPLRELTGYVVTAVGHILRQDRTGQARAALRDGVLLAGGGALRPEIAHDLCEQLGVPVQPAEAPHTVAVRGAARYLKTAHPLAPDGDSPPG